MLSFGGGGGDSDDVCTVGLAKLALGTNSGPQALLGSSHLSVTRAGGYQEEILPPVLRACCHHRLYVWCQLYVNHNNRCTHRLWQVYHVYATIGH